MNWPDIQDTVIYEGRSYTLGRGRVFLDWSNEPVLFHPQGCVLCCPIRIQHRPGSPPRHPDPCENCGFNRPSRSRLPSPCRFCSRTAHFTGPDGRPLHRGCLEAAILTRLRSAA